MPYCFALVRKGDPSKLHISLPAIDDDIRVAFNEPPDEDNYLAQWYDVIGFRLALGQDWEKIKSDFNKLKEKFPGDPMIDQWLFIADYIEAHYDVEAWAERR